MELVHVLESRPSNQEALSLFTWNASLTDLVRIPQTLRSLERLYPQHDPQLICNKFRTILDDIDKRSLCALILGSFITRQRDGKPANYVVEIDVEKRRGTNNKEALHNSLTIRCIDNDTGAAESYAGETEKLSVIQTQLALLPGKLLDSPISSEMREYFQKTEKFFISRG